jgi:hypothetical protein
MLPSLLPLFFSVVAAAGSGSFQPPQKRAVLDPIATDDPSSITGGQVACEAAPVGSFFDGLEPPVCAPALCD